MYTWSRFHPNRKYIQTTWYSLGEATSKKPTAAEIQEDLDDLRAGWNASFRRGKAPNRRPHTLGPLKLGPRVGRTFKRFTCEKEVKLWSDFEHVAVPGSEDLSPTELEEPNGARSTYVTRFSYYAREAGFIYSIRTRTPQNERLRHDYPEPLSYTDDDFKRFGLTQTRGATSESSAHPHG